MSTTPTTPSPGPSMWQKWVNFWFAPGDPTMLGFIRIVAGVLVMYVHAAYVFDLQSFFGRDGWYSLDAINRERREFPWMLSPPGDYEEVFRTARVPEFPHRRAAVMEFIRGIADRPDRMPVVQYVSRLQETRNQQTVREGLQYLITVGEAGAARKAQLDAFENEVLRQPRDVTAIPEFLKALPATGPGSRKEYREDIDRLLDALPRDVFQREYVLNHLIEMDLGTRQAFLEFLRDLPADAAERKKQIDYLEFWNNEERKAYQIGYPIFSLWFHVSDPTGMAAAHGVILFIMLLFTLGAFTRVTSVVTWLAAVSYIHRSQHVLFGMDTMMNIVLIYLMIGNSGAALSVDRLIRRYRASRASLRRTGTIDAPTRAYLDRPPPSASATLAIRLIQVHFCFIYMASGLSKLKGPAWWSATAPWDTLVNPEFCLVQYQWFEMLVRQMVSHRIGFGILGASGVIFTLALEISFAFLVWTRLRPYMVIWACLFHFGIAVFMGLYLFALFMMTLLLSYLPPHLVREQLFGAAGAIRSGLTFRFHNRSARQQRAAALAKALDFDDRVDLVESGRAGGPVTVTAGGRELTGREAARELLGATAFPRLTRCLLALPGIGSRLAAWFAPADGESATPPASPPPNGGRQPVGAK